MAFTQTYADDFNRADTNDINGSTTSVGSGTWGKNSIGGGRTGILLNAAQNNTDGQVRYYISGLNTANDCKAENVRGVGCQMGPLLRGDSDADPCYLWSISDNTVYKVNGGYTSIISPSSAGTTGDTISLEIVGTTITARVNGTSVGSTTDSALTSGTYGFVNNGGSALSDDWAAYEDTGGGAPTVSNLFHGINV